MTEAEVLGPAYYAARATGWRRDVWALLHPPYTAWHLSYVLIGASLAPTLNVIRLVATLLAFFLAVGIAAHALDELRGRPLQTDIPAGVLWAAASTGLLGAVALGIAGLFVVGLWLLPFIAMGVFFVFAYNLELLRGRVHGDFWFALSWGAFPVLTAYFAQTGRLSLAGLAVAVAGYALSYAQRMLSTPARLLRRKSRSVTGELILADGSEVTLDRPTLLRPLERALAASSWGIVALSLGLVASRLL
ncbi:MAG: UbiA prenyltransferase family protein [Candidatus Dormibacteraceae bacterium]